ncbi:hypothetical protein SAMN05428961_108249 [Paenibacillus sp. OK060]|nr:hypothetical protein SAMN05428961_108249 [Paenibacillus sp. OK060]SLK15369.1 hypothetical protein SAMN06272722_109262 [Paenibacillus sp. RU5A]SOC73906.1 hypothetical protein SAMN05880581_109262 [Paenibacillus sp. RU26A]SOC76123.1 hypothetical protein SAMN05880586_109262 [Paenibacillus sp. RU5M]
MRQNEVGIKDKKYLLSIQMNFNTKRDLYLRGPVLYSIFTFDSLVVYIHVKLQSLIGIRQIRLNLQSISVQTVCWSLLLIGRG